MIGTQTLLDAARQAGTVKRFHHVSTCEVYGDLALDTDEVFTEDSPYEPRTPYNASKAAADHAVRAYHETYGLPISITNCSNNYGPFQFPEKVIPLFVTNALDDKPLPMYASTQNKREWLHVRDHCRAIELVLESDKVGETYNVGSGIEASIEEIADLVLEAHREARLAEDDRPGPPGARPALPPRLVEAPAGARLGAGGRLGGRPARDRRVVRDEARVVGDRAPSRRPPGARGGGGRAVIERRPPGAALPAGHEHASRRRGVSSGRGPRRASSTTRGSDGGVETERPHAEAYAESEVEAGPTAGTDPWD